MEEELPWINLAKGGFSLSALTARKPLFEPLHRCPPLLCRRLGADFALGESHLYINLLI